MNRQKIKDAFDSYVQGFDLNNPKIRLKYEHTYHVAENCEEIAEDVFENEAAAYAHDSRLAGETAEDTAWLIGMLHDIGRFEQLKRYDTFNDRLSIDHAAFGADLLFGEEHLIRNFSDNARLYPLLEEAVRDHSLYRLPEGLDPVTEIFCNIIRDADKIDILRVNFAVPQSEIYSLPEEEIAASTITPEVLKVALTENRAVPRELYRTPADHFVGHICLCYELVFDKSREMAKTQGFLDKLFEYPFTDPEKKEGLRKLREHMRR